jgi:hypothetical protein
MWHDLGGSSETPAGQESQPQRRNQRKEGEAFNGLSKRG